MKDFKTSKLSNLFHVSAYRSPEETEKLHQAMSEILHSAQSEITPFETFLETLAQRGCVRRHYTQNIDARDTRLPSLAEKTIHLHGRLDEMRCQKTAQHLFPVSVTTFTEHLEAVCPICKAAELDRASRQLRPRGAGILRPNVLLYGAPSPDEDLITTCFERDIGGPVDGILIVGTRLKIPALRRFVERLSRKARSGRKDVPIVWLNAEAPQSSIKMDALLDYQILGNCDMF